MRLALIADAYPPTKSSAALQIRDLAKELSNLGHEVVVIVPNHSINYPSQLEFTEEYAVLRLKTLKIKDIGYIKRFLNEILMPFLMYFHYRKTKYKNLKWDAVIWYSPSIFLGLFVSFLKKDITGKCYLIIRDIFPDWALDIGLIKKTPLFFFLKIISYYQYKMADIIGVQTNSNKLLFNKFLNENKIKVEVLNNWYDKKREGKTKFSLDHQIIKSPNKKICIYAGNMGIAQELDIFLDLAKKVQFTVDILFIFVGRGTHYSSLKKRVKSEGITNTIFFNEITPSELNDLYSKCDIGLISLNSKFKIDNIPGKFLSYLSAGLPVLACVNPNNDLIDLVNESEVGCATSSKNIEHLYIYLMKIIKNIDDNFPYAEKCSNLFEKNYTSSVAAKQISKGLIDF